MLVWYICLSHHMVQMWKKQLIRKNTIAGQTSQRVFDVFPFGLEEDGGGGLAVSGHCTRERIVLDRRGASCLAGIVGDGGLEQLDNLLDVVVREEEVLELGVPMSMRAEQSQLRVRVCYL